MDGQLKRLMEAGRRVIEAWPTNSLATEVNALRILLEEIRGEMQNPDNDKWVSAARAIHEEEGWVEIDDDYAAVSNSPDGDGAYVAAWVWIPRENLNGI